MGGHFGTLSSRLSVAFVCRVVDDTGVGSEGSVKTGLKSCEVDVGVGGCGGDVNSKLEPVSNEGCWKLGGSV